jgi:hypothetical protein
VKKHLRVMTAAFAVLALALVGCDDDNGGLDDGLNGDGVEDNGLDDGLEDDGLEDDGLDDDLDEDDDV